MDVLHPGHRYALENLKGKGVTTLQFFQDEKIHGTRVDGPSCQEVIRAIIERVQTLDKEKPWEGNKDIIMHARKMIALFEHRALMLKIEKDDFPIETFKTGFDGHLILKE
jgi:hypothetical protein